MSKYSERKRKLVEKYNTNVPAISSEQMEWIIEHYNEKANRAGVDWTMVAYAVNENILMLRYVCANKYDCKELKAEECARFVLDFSKRKHYMFEKWRETGEWKNTKCCYFRYGSHWNHWNRQYFTCRDTQKYVPGFVNELLKIDEMKYLDVAHYMEINKWWLTDAVSALSRRAGLYEKLTKIGMEDVAEKDFGEYSYREIRYDAKETSLVKMLGIDRRYFKVFREARSLKALKMLQEYPGLTDRELKYAEAIGWNGGLINRLKKSGISMDRILTDMEKHLDNKTFASDWLDNLILLKELNYPLDRSYLFPADFVAEHARLIAEKNEKQRVEREKAQNKMSEKIRQLSEAIQKNREFREFFDGCDGLMIKVPESAEDLRREGKLLHNCLSTYIDRVANGQTMIFFVRRIDQPDAPYVAMEYSDGRIIQRRFDYNKAVDNEKVINFTNRLADKLRAAA